MVAKLVALVIPLGLDTFAIAAALGMAGAAPAHRLRVTGLFVAFEAGMPLVGLAVGAPLSTAIGGAAQDVAIAVLLALGLHTIFCADQDEDAQIKKLAQLRGPGVLLLGLSISLDELAVGFTLGLLRLPVGLVIVLIAVQALIVTQLGLRLGNRLSEAARDRVERLAGAALAGLGMTLLVGTLA